MPAFLLKPINPPPFPEGKPMKKCFISIAASAEQIVSIGKAAERTWVRDMVEHCDVRYDAIHSGISMRVARAFLFH